MKPTYEEALAFCVQHYVDRGNTVEDATAYVTVRERTTFSVSMRPSKRK